MIRTYSNLRRLRTFEERWKYLALKGKVGEATFGFDRYINQQFYRSREWALVRQHIILRDNGCDLGVEGHDIHSRLTIHHLNPMTKSEILEGDESILDPEFLITTVQLTHNAIHYGDEKLLPKPMVERRPGDTRLW